MGRERWLWMAALSAMTACAQIIHADFDDLKPREAATGASGAGGGTGGQGGAGEGGAAGSGEVGGISGASGTGGTPKDASPDVSSSGTGGGLPDARPDVERDPDAVITGPAIVINELQGIGSYDWIELYNPGTDSFVLDGYGVTQAQGSVGAPDLPSLLVFPQNTTVTPGGFVFILCKQLSQGGPVTGCATLATSCFTVTWGISSSEGEIVYLLGRDLGQGRPILDQVYYPDPAFDGGAPVAGQSYGRIPNGTGDFRITKPTPNLPNEF